MVIAILILSGCTATPVGNQPGGQVPSRLFLYAEQDTQLAVTITSAGPLNLWSMYLHRDSSLDNHPSRPAGIPSTYVAYATGEVIYDNSTEYTADLFLITSFGTSEFVDHVDPWTGGNSPILIH
jgi:hypothetical protein